ncbi:MAG: Ldh family oxidoreductase [Betaproteobacteria bacterium]|nr:Ldh family oxidoreductase [Betaproteobacteria bacterium]
MQTISPDRVRLTVDEARTLGINALKKTGFDDEQAAVITDHVVDAALCGYEYSGMPKLLNVIEHPNLRQPRRRLTIVHETPVSAQVDGGNSCGMYALMRAAEMAIERAQKHGFGVIGMNNSWMSGRGAIFVETIARAGLIGLHTVSATRYVAPPGAAKAAYGTNPLSFGFPTEGEPFVIDLGTSAFMATDLQFRERRGEPLPEGVAIDKDGKPTRDAKAARAGALLAFGGYKGFALAMAAQAMGVFAHAGSDQEGNYGYIMIAMKPDLLIPLADYRKQLSATLARIKATPRQPGVDEIRLPGERSLRERAQRLGEGIVIDRFVYEALANAREGQLPPLG